MTAGPPDPKRQADERELAELAADKIKGLGPPAKLVLAAELHRTGRLDLAAKVTEMALDEIRLAILLRDPRGGR